MKILIVSHEYPPIGGGGSNACMFLAKEFVKQSNEVTILTAKYGSQQEEELTEEKIRIHRVKCMRKKVESSNFVEMLTFLLSAWKKADILAKNKQFDMCLVFFGIPSGPIALYLRKKYNLPYVIRSGGGDIPGTQKRFKYVYKLLAPAIRVIWKNASGIVANSDGLKERAERFENRYPISVIENGVDMNFFTPSEGNKENNIVQLLFVSRLLERKGLQFVIPELKRISEELQSTCNKQIRLIVVGDGPYRQQLEELVADSGCQDLVRFEGQKDKFEVTKYYKDADIFLLPSLWEGMPNVVLEAMASGLPIIMTPCEGSKELVTDNGFICEHNEMSGKIITLGKDDELRKQMGNNSLHIVKEKYQWSEIGKRYLDFIEVRRKN